MNVKLDSKKLIFICIFVCSCDCKRSGKVIDVGGLVVNVVKTGLEVYEIVRGENLLKDPKYINDVVDKFQKEIATSTHEIKTFIGLSTKLGLIDDAVVGIHSSLIDVVNILKSKTLTERDEYKRLFVKRFEQNGIIKYIRFLPQLLSYTIPGASGKLIDLLADNTRCNMTALYAFGIFYVNLLSDGITVDLLYLHLSTTIHLNKTISEWNESLEKVENIFYAKQSSCIKNFPELAQEDVNNAEDAVTLWADNKQRYPWKTSDVLFLKSYGTFQFLYHKSRDNHLFWQRTSTRNKIAVFDDTNETVSVSEVFGNVSETFKSSIDGKEDDKAAQRIGQAVEKHLKDQGLAINALVVFFEGGDMSTEKIQIDDESPVIQLSLEDVKLEYCYEGFFGCSVDALNWFGGTKEVSGKMKVFAYVIKTENGSTTEEPTYEIGSCTYNYPLPVAIHFVMIVGFLLLV